MLQDRHLAHVKKKRCFSHSGYVIGHGRETTTESWKAASRKDLGVVVDSGKAGASTCQLGQEGQCCSVFLVNSVFCYSPS